jgi:hypothetical protein
VNSAIVLTRGSIATYSEKFINIEKRSGGSWGAKTGKGPEGYQKIRQIASGEGVEYPYYLMIKES